MPISLQRFFINLQEGLFSPCIQRRCGYDDRSAKSLELDEDGYLRDIDNWDVRVAEQLAKLEGVGELTGEHWKLITAIRLHYERNRVSPICRDILIETGYTKMDMYRLFPSLGYKSAFKLAGLPKPIEC